MEGTKIIELLAAIGAGSAVTAAVTQLLTRRKTASETNKMDAESENIRAELEIKINKAALELIESLRTEVANLTKKIETYESTNQRLTEENQTLREEVDILKQHVGVCESELGLENDSPSNS